MRKLSVKHVAKSFDSVTVLRDITFEANSGEVILIRGSNGAGKSTLLQCIAHLLTPDSGIVELSDNGKPVTRRCISYAGDVSFFYEELTVSENLCFWQKVCGGVPKDILTLVQQFSLESFLHKPIRACSLGMRRAAALACSLIGDPAVICWDEPMVGLDRERKVAVEQALLLHLERGALFVLTSHEDVLPEVHATWSIVKGVLQPDVATERLVRL